MADRKRNTFVFNEDWGESIDNAPQNERLLLYEAIRKYAIYDEDTKLPTYSSAVMSIVKQQIDRNKQKFEEVRRKRIEAGRIGNLKRWGDSSQKVADVANASTCDICEQMSQMVANVANIADNGNGNVNGNVNENIDKKNKSKKESRFIPPTIEEIRAYATEKGYEFVDAEMFWNFYESKNWMIGKNKMTKWRSAVANWNKTEQKRNKYGTGRQFNGKNREEYVRDLYQEQVDRAPRKDVGTAEDGSGTVQTKLPFD